ncbi:disulfide bond formation protein DsbA [Actinosynnema sp. ALI-1.44]|uniref:mycothiol-dependent nitroreductase Rv2466c family protein n=1 Tax=Actinosynnema sp. ALI-1.44 TaxID=1933779 RepID=UPI00097C77A2|nr:disulfide bond formation protein DsbA [Actinosynnema sp. ALI-1.44]ONI77073.1 disulfide bond formation protein DsbA [Actinosynnema sp. ALI-1.44]
MTVVDIWFDPSCPYTWGTSRWLVEVTKVRPVSVRWNVMSLSVLNEGRDDDPEGDPEGYLWYPVRVCAAVREKHGHEALGRFYTELWNQENGADDWIGDFARALQRAGLPTALATSGPEYDDAVRASHAEAMARLGPHIGTPIVAVDDIAFFGPVLSRVPTGEQAGRLWDGALLVAATPGFNELVGHARTPL